MCLYQTFFDFTENNIERKMWDSAKCKTYLHKTLYCLEQTEIDIKTKSSI